MPQWCTQVEESCTKARALVHVMARLRTSGHRGARENVPSPPTSTSKVNRRRVPRTKQTPAAKSVPYIQPRKPNIVSRPPRSEQSNSADTDRRQPHQALIQTMHHARRRQFAAPLPDATPIRCPVRTARPSTRRVYEAMPHRYIRAREVCVY